MDIRSQAADWLLRLEEAKGDKDLQAAFEAWRDQDPRHEKVFRQMEQIWSTATTTPSVAPRHRKRTLLISVAILVMLLTQLLPMSVWFPDARTDGGEVKRISLTDGSYLVLNSNSAIEIDYDDASRTIHLIRGEVVAQVAHDISNRPFRIENRDGSAIALGTRYLVRQQAEDTVVAVLESRVGVSAHDIPEQVIALHAGEQVRLDSWHVGRVEAAPADVGDWASDRLTFQDAPLHQVIAALNTHHHGSLHMPQTEGMDLRFTGTLPAYDLALALRLLEQSLPLKAKRVGDRWVLAAIQNPTSD